MITLRRRPRNRAGATAQSLAYFNGNIAFRTLFDAICAVSGFVFVDYALSLGIPKEKIGYFPALVNLACLFQIVGLWAAHHFRDRKRFVLLFGILEPVVLIIAVIGTLFAPAHLRFLLLVGLLFLAGSSMHMTRPVTDAWLATAIPARIRGRVLGRRFQVISIVTITGMLIMGLVAEHVRRDNSLGFGLILVCGSLLGLLAVLMFRRITLPMASEEARLCWADVPHILRHRPFMRFLAAVLLYNIPFWLLTPYHQVYHLKVLNLHETTIAGIMMGSYAINSLLSPFFGRWADRLGPRRITYLFTPCYVGYFVMYVLSSPQHPWPILVAWVLFGIANAAYASANTAALYHSIQDSPLRQPFFAAYNLGLFLMTAVMATVSTLLVGVFKDLVITIGPLVFGQFKLLYLTSLLLFCITFFGTRLLPGRARE